MKRCLPLLFLFFNLINFSALSAVVVFDLPQFQVQAAGFALTAIGASSTVGQTFSQWTYYGTNPVFQGTATPGADVTIQVDSSAKTVTASALGEWTWQPTNLATAGSHAIVLSSGTDSQSFTLIIADSNESSTPSSTTGSTTTTATTTGTTPTSTTSGSITTPTPSPTTAVSTSSATLPQTGSFDTTVFLTIAGMIFLGAGLISSVFMPQSLGIQHFLLVQQPQKDSQHLESLNKIKSK